MTKAHAFYLTGAARKPLIEAIESFANVKGIYQGAPKFGYAFFGLGVLDKEGTLHFDCDLQIIMDCVTWLELHGFACDTTPEVPAEPEAEIADRESRTYQAELGDPDCPDRMEVFSAEDNVDAIRQAREFCEGEVVLLELFELDENYNVLRGVEIPPCRLTITVPLEGFSPEAIDRVCKLVASKETLLKMALGVDALPVQVLDDQLAFPWFANTEDGDRILAYSQLITAICRTALKKTRVNAQAKEDYPNPRFTMRCWLISLGLVGDEFRLIRRLCTSTLPGNGAWSRGADPRKVAQAEALSDDEIDKMIVETNLGATLVEPEEDGVDV